MSRHLTIVTWGFFVTATALGLPSLAGLLYFGQAALEPGVPVRQSPGAPADSVTGLIEMAAHIASGAIALMGGLGKAISGMMAILCFFVLLYSLALFLTARYMNAGQRWARIAASVLVAPLPLFPVLALGAVGLNHLIFPIALVGAAAGGYTLWALWRREEA